MKLLPMLKLNIVPDIKAIKRKGKRKLINFMDAEGRSPKRHGS